MVRLKRIKIDENMRLFDQHAEAESFQINNQAMKKCLNVQNITDFLFYAYM